MYSIVPGKKSFKINTVKYCVYMTVKVYWAEFSKYKRKVKYSTQASCAFTSERQNCTGRVEGGSCQVRKTVYILISESSRSCGAGNQGYTWQVRHTLYYVRYRLDMPATAFGHSFWPSWTRNQVQAVAQFWVWQPCHLSCMCTRYISISMVLRVPAHD